MPEILRERLDALAGIQQHRCVEVPQGMHAAGSGRLDPGCGQRSLPDVGIEVVTVQGSALAGVEQQPSGCRLCIGSLPRQADRQWREHRDVRGEFGGHCLRERDVAGLAAFWQGEDELAADQLDLANDMQGAAEELNVVDREPEDFPLPEPTAGGDRRGDPISGRQRSVQVEYLSGGARV
jgi:hypothetical protein